MDVCGTGGLCDGAREVGVVGGGGSQQQPHSASLRLLRKRALLRAAGWRVEDISATDNHGRRVNASKVGVK